MMQKLLQMMQVMQMKFLMMQKKTGDAKIASTLLQMIQKNFIRKQKISERCKEISL
jgi:hypothetical protein